VVADIVRLRGDYEIVGFIDDVNPERAGSKFGGADVLGGRERLEHLRQDGVGYLLLGFGNCEARLELARLVREKGFRLATAVHPSAVVAADAVIGAGTVVAAGAVINPGATIGENVIVNTCASVDHDCRVEDGAHVCPGVRLAGNVFVGRAAWVGIGATVVDRTRIGSGAIIGAGAVVVDDMPDGVVARGVPARVIRTVRPDA
jgi:UDP-N-acetylbacillosamine N-acetyltransferase